MNSACTKLEVFSLFLSTELVNVDAILEAFHRYGVHAILIGGMNFLLRHQPVLTFDVDLWVQDTDENLLKVRNALHDLKAEWGPDEASWKPIPEGFSWLRRQSMYCLTTEHGALDIFREVAGLEGQYDACRDRCSECRTASGTPYASLSNQDMLACQMALPEGQRRLDRVAYLTRLLKP
jgi:hypothetical protein